MPNLLAIDDDRTVLQLLKKAFADSDFVLSTFATAEEGLERVQQGGIDVCLLDIMLPGMNGLDLARLIHKFDARLPVIFITSNDDSDTAIEAMKIGAYDFCIKPLSIDDIRNLVDRALENRRLMMEPISIQGSDETVPESGELLVGKSQQMLGVYKQIGRVAAQNVPVLIRGESGTGKELIARAIYQYSERSSACYLAVNCAALSDTLLESELFGHEKGSFTGADRRHIGKFEQCDNGTIFLDEIGDMSPSLQSKVLRLLQEQTFERVGGRKTIKTNARIISATNRDLEAMIESNEFRLDLYHRINAVEVHLPPLRERGSDIALLTNHFLAKYSASLQKPIEGISSDAVELLHAYHWPGNVRELQSVIRRAILMSTGPVIVPESISAEIHVDPDDEVARDQNGIWQPTDANLTKFIQSRVSAGSNNLYAESLQLLENELITRILSQTNGNQSKAADVLGITRGSLRNKIRALGIEIGSIVTNKQ